MNPSPLEHAIETKMRSAGVPAPTVQAFLHSVEKVRSGDRGLLPERAIEPVTSLPSLANLRDGTVGRESLKRLAVVKLNGGLGTSMGLEKAKSLIAVKGLDTFLDFIARQILHLRAATHGPEPAFYLMDSFATQRETLAYLQKYPQLQGDDRLDFLQNMVPKIDAHTFEPVSWPAQPDLEWCPPGHGDLYPSLLSSGVLERLLRRGVIYLFVSNSDNLGATVDLQLLEYFASSGHSFLMEVAERTPADRKGGHLARSRESGRLLLRESAQCPKEDEASFQDVERHRFFNTNNLWVRLDHLQAELERNGGSFPLPLITNRKTVDPKDANSPAVLQLESAMGAAIECFERTGAIVVPRTRFSPVKATSDLLALRSDAYRVTEDYRLVLEEARSGRPPLIELDSRLYKLLPDFDQFFPGDIPSLKGCDSFRVIGPVRFESGVVCEGKVEFANNSGEAKAVPAGVYRDRGLTL